MFLNKRINNQKTAKQKSKILLFLSSFLDSLSKLISSSFFLGHFSNHSAFVQKCKDSAVNRFFSRLFSFKPKILNFKLKCAALSENSMTLNALEKLMYDIFHSSLRSYGIFLLSFGAVIISLNLSSGIDNLYKLAYSDTFILALILSLVSLILLPIKNKNLAQAIQASKIISNFFTYYFSLKHINCKDNSFVKSTTGSSMFFGLLCGIISYSISPRLILFIFFIGFILYITLTKPENGILTLFLLFPLLSQRLTAFIIVITSVSTAFKILRGKRSLHINIASAVFIIFSFIVVSSTVYSLDKTPENDPVMLFIILLAAFIMQTLIKSSAFADKCISMLLLSSAATIIYNLYNFLVGFISSGNYSDILNSILSAQSSGTFINSNAFAAYLICVFPFIFVQNSNILHSKMLSLILVFIAIFSIILTDSPFAIFALTAALIFTLIVFNKRQAPIIILIIAFIISVLYLFPSIFSIPTDVFTTNNMYTLKDAVIEICKKFWISGVGIGDSSVITAEIISGAGVNALTNHINSYVNLFIKLGFPLTFICFSLALILISRPYSYAVSKHASPNAKNKCMIICTSTLALIIYAFKFNVFSDFKTTLMLFLLLTLGYSVCDSADNDYVSDFNGLQTY